VPARNTPVQLLALDTDPESDNAQRYRQTDGHTDGRTTDRVMLIAESDHRAYCLVVRSAKNA